MVVQCCKCQRVQNDSQWIEPVPDVLAIEEVSHGYCPPCAEDAMALVDSHFEQKRSAAGQNEFI